MTATTILPPEADPIATLRTMAAFGMDEGRGVAEILIGAVAVTAGIHVQSNPQPVIGLAILCKNPEATPIPIFDQATRAVEVTMLADWLKARGYEASACRWHRKPPTRFGQLDMPWMLVTGPAEVPKLPPEFPQGDDVSNNVPPRQQGKSWAQRLWETGNRDDGSRPTPGDLAALKARLLRE